MNYWLTTHWPPLEDRADRSPSGVVLPDGREQAGKDLRPGDCVLIYESRTGRSVLKHDPNGREYRVKSRTGRQGIVLIAEVITDLTEEPDSQPQRYSNGSCIWWRWRAETRPISQNGFVPREEVNRILGYSKANLLRGFGDRKSGLKRLTEQEYFALVDLFKQQPRSLPAVRKLLNTHQQGSSVPKGVGESIQHRQLKEYIAAGPSVVLGESGLKTLHVEYEFPTGDRADLVLEDQFGRIIGLEVEVSVGSDQLEGVLQAIKHRFMLALIKERLYTETRAFLAAYALSPEIRGICDPYEVECFTIDFSEVQQWSERTQRDAG